MQRPQQFQPHTKRKPTSNRQRRKELDAKRQAKRDAEARTRAAAALAAAIKGKVLVNAELLSPTNSYSTPAFVEKGYYVDEPYSCRDCGKEQVWTATQQKWWFEVAKGNVWARESRCLACRRRRREQKAALKADQAERTAKYAARVRLPKSSQHVKAKIR